MDPDKINKLRQTIDEIDNALLDSLQARFHLMPSILAYKQAVGLAIEDPVREEKILQKVGEKAAQVGIDPRAVQKIFRIIIDESKRIQEGLQKK